MILIAFGGNLSSRAGAPADTMRATLAELSQKDVALLAVSRFFATPAWPDPSEPLFVNGVARIQTELSPLSLLARLQDTERSFGREHSVRNAPRTLDLDILDYDGSVQAGPPELPHPRLESRAFVLIPMRDVAPDWCHPVSGKSLDDLIAELPATECEAVKPISEV